MPFQLKQEHSTQAAADSALKLSSPVMLVQQAHAVNDTRKRVFHALGESRFSRRRSNPDDARFTQAVHRVQDCWLR